MSQVSPAFVPASVPFAILADPERDTRALHATLLQPLAVDLAEAEDGTDALALALARPPALVVTELRLPRIDGCTLCKRLRQDPATREASIIIVAGRASPEQIDRARCSGADQVLIKPADPLQLREAARDLIRRSQLLRGRATSARQRGAEQLQRSQGLLDRIDQVTRRILWRKQGSLTTTTPPLAAPGLRCPECNRALAYDHSVVGGVSEKGAEQWDYYQCVRCGTFQYRHRTRRLRRI